MHTCVSVHTDLSSIQRQTVDSQRKVKKTCAQKKNNELESHRENYRRHSSQLFICQECTDGVTMRPERQIIRIITVFSLRY